MPRTHWSFFLPARDHSFVKWLAAQLQIRWTRTGTILLAAFFIGGSVASAGTHIPAFLLPSFLLSVLITAAVLSRFQNPDLTMSRIIENEPSAGDDWIYRVRIRNTGSRPVRHLSVFEGCLPFGIYPAPDHEDARNHIEWLDPGQEDVVTLVTQCPRRGFYRLPPLKAGSSFPLGLTRRPVTGARGQTLHVLPKVSPESSDQDFDTRHPRPGVAPSRRAGHSTEFLGTREFRRGDRVHDVHWPSTARAGELIVKEYAEEHVTRMGYLIDTEYSIWKQPGRFESSISRTAAMAARALKDGHAVDIFTFDTAFRHFESDASPGAGQEALLRFLSRLDTVNRVNLDRFLAACVTPARELSLLTIFWKQHDARRERFCEQLRKQGVPLRVLIL